MTTTPKDHAAPRRTDRYYGDAELGPFVGRPGACAGLALPSRVGSRLYYRDGRITDLNGQPIR